MLAAGILAAGMVATIAFRTYDNSARKARTASVELKSSPETIAVLPFRDISAATSDGWGIGITDAIISRLTSLQNLAVRPTTSVMKYAKDAPEPTEAAKALGVESVLEGTYQRASGVTRVTVQLIDGQTGTTKWSQRYDLKNADILSFEDEVATKVVAGLQIEISPTEQKAIQKPVTTSVDAYNNYLQARFDLNEYFMTSRLDSLEKGQHAALHAISQDKDFADAYALLAVLYGFQAANFEEDAEGNMKRCEVAAQNALRINPESAEAVIALATAYSEQGKEADAIRTSKRAVELAPNSPVAWEMLGYSYYYAGLNEPAELAYRKVIELNPTAPHSHWMHARMLLYNGRGPEAEQEMREVVAKNPDQFKALAYFGQFLYYNGKLDEAEQALDKARSLGGDTTDNTARMAAGFLYASRNQRAKIDRRLFGYTPDHIIDGDAAYWTGGIYALLGDKQHALVWLKRTVALGNVNYPWFQRDKNYDSLRSDPDYQAVMADVRRRWEAYRNEFDPGR